MLKFFKKKKRSQGVNAVVLSDEGIAYVCISHDVGQPLSLKSFHYSAIGNKAETSATLKKLFKIISWKAVLFLPRYLPLTIIWKCWKNLRLPKMNYGKLCVGK